MLMFRRCWPVLVARSGHRSELLRQKYQPLTPAEKFRIASEMHSTAEHSFSRESTQPKATRANAKRSFGLGAAGFGKYFGAGYGDLSHRQLHDSGGIPYAASPGLALLPRRASGAGVKAPIRGRPNPLDTPRFQHNTIQPFGNRREPDNRTAREAAAIGIDTAGNILKELWPDLERSSIAAKNEIHGDRRRDLGS